MKKDISIKKDKKGRLEINWSFKKLSMYVILFFMLLLILHSITPFHNLYASIIFLILNAILFSVNRNILLSINTAFSMFLVLPSLYDTLFHSYESFYYPGLIGYILCLLFILMMSFYTFFKKYYILNFFVVIFGTMAKPFIDFAIDIF